MRRDNPIHLTPRIEEAIQELKDMITAHFPQATFVVEEGFDPEGMYLVTTVDIADTDEVTAAIRDRLLALQVDEGLPLYVTPLRPIERVIADFGSGKPLLLRRQHRCRSSNNMPDVEGSVWQRHLPRR